MAIDITTARTEVAKLYIAAFNRVPDASGLSFWVNSYVAGTDTLATMSQKFANSAEYVAAYPSFMTNDEYVTAIYSNVFGRAADTAGQAFWVGHLAAGTITRGGLMQEMVKGAQGTDATKLTNQATFGVWAAANGSSVTTASTYLASITSDAATVTAAQAAVTAAMDNDLSGDIALTSALNLVNSVKGQTVYGDETTLTTGDTINGDGNVDLDFSNAGAISGETINGADALQVENTGITTVRASDWTNLGGITVNNSTGTLTLNDLQAATVPLAVTDYVDAAGVMTFNYDAQAVAGADDIALSVSEVTAGVALTGGIIEELTLQINDVAGAVSTLASLAFTNDAADSKVTTLEINGGTAGLAFGITAALDADLDTIAAGDALANLSLSAFGNTEVMAVTLGAGNDSLNMGDGLTSDTIAGGEGTDMVAVNTASATVRTPNMTGVETMNAVFGASSEYDMSNTTGLKTLNLGLLFDGTTELASLFAYDFNDLKAETSTVNIHHNADAIELDYEADVDLVMDFETADNAVVIANDIDLINVDELVLTNQGDNNATVSDAIDLNADTTKLTIATTTQGGNLILDDAAASSSSILDGSSLVEVTVNYTHGDITASDTLAAAGDFIEDADALQYYTVTGSDADTILGQIGSLVVAATAVGAADELERITITMTDEATLDQGYINAQSVAGAGAEINEITITASDKNTVASAAAGAGAAALMNIVIDGIQADEVERMTINAVDGGDVAIDQLGAVLNEYVLTGTGDVFITADAAGLNMTQLGTATSFSGRLTLQDALGADTLRGTGDADTINVVSADAAADSVFGGAGNDTITVRAAATGVETIDGGDGNDGTTVAAASVADIVYNTSAGTDTLTLATTATSDDTIQFNDALIDADGTLAITNLDVDATNGPHLDYLSFDGVGGISAVAGTAAGVAIAAQVNDNAIYVVDDGDTVVGAGAQVIALYTDLDDVASFLDEITSSTSSSGDEAIFVINNVTQTAATGNDMDAYIYYYAESDGVSGIEDSEIQLIGTVNIVDTDATTADTLITIANIA